MNLQRSLDSIEKSKCPDDCPFKHTTSQIALIPPPRDPNIMIISRDPTTTWMHFYDFALQSDSKNEERRKMIYTAIPPSIVLRIITFMKDNINEQDKKALFNLLASWPTISNS